MAYKQLKYEEIMQHLWLKRLCVLGLAVGENPPPLPPHEKPTNFENHGPFTSEYQEELQVSAQVSSSSPGNLQRVSDVSLHQGGME